MSNPVARTCTELATDRDPSIIFSEPKPLSAFRQSQALVLLGDAGSGKTTEFNREFEALGDTAELLSARNFTTLDVDSHPEWREKTLFIDGLDEMRAGTSDSVTPLDQIRSRLDRLGRPWFRISCREADWLGTNDRQSLATVSPDSQITVLRLDLLDDDGIRALLTSLDLSGDVEEFIDKARQRGLGTILHNPQTLKLLAEAVEQGGEWPNSRQETFELACQKMASEWNEEHLERADPISSDTTMDATGYLCALQLLAGSEGYSTSRRLDGASFPSIEELQDPPNRLPYNSLRPALATRLFSGVVERRLSPVHRHIAEFLAGRYLARLIKNGLPVERIMALMTSPSDQRVVTVLRGLSAWLAAHSPSARRRLIDLDPVGVGLYGDIKGLPVDEQRHLLESLAEFAKLGQLFGHERADDRGSTYIESTAQAFRSLASDDMIPAIKDLLTKPVADPRDHRMAEFILGVLAKADEPDLKSLGILSPCLEAILRDPAKPSHVKDLAWDAFIHIAPSGDQKERTLLELLQEIQDGVIPDPDGQLRGALLSSLYPNVLGPSEVWLVALPLNPYDISYRMHRFLDEDLLKESSSQQVAELLDALFKDASTLVPSLNDTMLYNLPFGLLGRGLEECGEHTELPRLYDWLSILGKSFHRLRREEDRLRRIQSWLEAHPHIQKYTFLAFLREYGQQEPATNLSLGMCTILLDSTPPPDFGVWCLTEAAELAESEPLIAQHLLKQSYRSLPDPAINRGLTLDVMRSATLGYDQLERQLQDLCSPPPDNSGLSESEKRWRTKMAELEEEKRERQAGWGVQLREKESELRENRFFPPDLHTLSLVYFGKSGGTSQDAPPDQRISEFIGGHPDLADAVILALRGAIWRDDVPDAEETISLILDSKFSWLAHPTLASLDLLYKEDPAYLEELDDTLKRKALAIHFCVFSHLNFLPNRHSPWFDHWMEQEPSLVLEVLFECAHAAMKAGEQFLPGLSELDRIEETRAELAIELSTELVRAFPTRAHQSQMHLLDRFLDKLLKAGTTAFEQLVEEKLAMSSMTVSQRIRWLTVGALVSPGRHLETLEGYAGENQTRVRYLAEFLCNRFHNNWFKESPIVTNLSPQAVAALIRLLGSTFQPIDLHASGPAPPGFEISWRLQDLISLLGAQPSHQANSALRELIDNTQLLLWRDRLRWAEERQRVLLRDAAYSHPSIKQVQCTLDNGLPANASDLAALLNDHLDGIADDIRGNNSNLWRQFWNEEPELTAKHEDACRDALLAMLQARLPPEVDVAREGHYVSDKRADIRVSYGGFNVPVEIKKDSPRDLWSALQEQLIEQYTTDPATSGHGIYLVLWTGGDKISRRPDGNHPATPDELRELLEDDLTPDQASKISVKVLDVTKP
ncbi:MAG: hypothetical protein OXG34_07430 [bacterium]|nr:hypothetical protein [bacterium]